MATPGWRLQGGDSRDGIPPFPRLYYFSQDATSILCMSYIKVCMGISYDVCLSKFGQLSGGARRGGQGLLPLIPDECTSMTWVL